LEAELLRLVGYAQLASLHGRDAAAATGAYASFYAVQDTLDGAAICALGCWLVVTNWVSRPYQAVPWHAAPRGRAPQGRGVHAVVYLAPPGG
jgi:hypothetical protein